MIGLFLLTAVPSFPTHPSSCWASFHPLWLLPSYLSGCWSNWSRCGQVPSTSPLCSVYNAMSCDSCLSYRDSCFFFCGTGGWSLGPSTAYRMMKWEACSRWSWMSVFWHVPAKCQHRGPSGHQPGVTGKAGKAGTHPQTCCLDMKKIVQ